MQHKGMVIKRSFVQCSIRSKTSGSYLHKTD